MLYGVALSAAAIAILPWGLARSPETVAASAQDSSTPPLADLPAADRPAADHRRVAAAEPLPGLYSSDGSAAEPSAPVPSFSPSSSTHRTPEGTVDGSRPVPFPRMAEADEPIRSETAAPRTFPRASTLEEARVRDGFSEAPPTGESPQDVASGEAVHTSALPLPLPPPHNPEIAELRREVGRLAESHLRDQTQEIQKAQQILVEMQTAKQIDLLRDQIGMLRQQQDEARRAAAQPAAPPPMPSSAPPLPPSESSSGPAAAPAKPKAIEIEPAGETGRYTIRLREAPLNVALNEVAVLAGWNVVTGPEFSGDVTATLTDVAPEEAIDAILRVHGWTVRKEGRFLLIERLAPVPPADSAPGTEPAAKELRTQVFQLQHVPAPALLPHLQPLLTPEIGQASSAVADGDDPQTAAQAGHDRIVVRDRQAALDKISGLVAQLDLPPRQVELDTVILQVERTGLTQDGLKQRLAAYLESQTQGDLPCPRCGRRHRVAAPVDPACILPQPAWTTAGGAGWEFTQLRGTDEFVVTIKKFARAEVIARPRLRIAHQQLAEIGMAGLVGERNETEIQTVGVQFANAGPLLSVRPFVLDSGEVRLHVESRPSRDAAAESLSDSTTGTDIVVQKDCSLAIAGLHAEQTLPAGNGRMRTANYEIVILLTPRVVP